MHRLARPRSRTSVALLAACSLLAVAPARADDVETLRAEVVALRARLAAVLEGCAARPPDEVVHGAAPRSERVAIPCARTTLLVEDDPAGGSSILTPWQRTDQTAGLPRREWFRLGGRSGADGATTGAWLLLVRNGGSGSAKVAAGRIEADGRVIELPVEDYVVARDAGGESGAAPARVRRERVRFAVPPEVLTAIADADRARFVAGASSFELTDAHRAAFAGLAVRLAAPVAPAVADTKPGSRPD